KEVLETSGDEPFFVPCRKDRDDSRGTPITRSIRNVGIEIGQIPQSFVVCFPTQAKDSERPSQERHHFPT
ncbi:hypothetical protein, partial [Mesorhizobium sp. M7A.F.Ca.MR.362.00.0.0]|uniref:hypothetical protein n=1 Tax=Mesorhizobium sp. M7A.F.Ca.MR.362.00.0.0 TaxID=2496779 RepID=UPI001FE050A1